MSDVASTEFLRLIKFSFDDSSDVLRAYTKAKLIDPHYGGSIIRFLDKKKHEFYHKLQASVACCVCGNNFNPTNPDMPSWIFNQLYEINSGIKCNQPLINRMKNRFCLCRILSNQRVSLDELDISVINHLLRQCSYSTSDTENIATIRDVLCRAWKTDKFTKAEYENIWKVLEVATLSLASEVNIYYHKSIQNVLKKSRKYDVEKEDVKKLLADIDTTLKQIHSGQTEISSMSSNEILATVSTISTELSDIKRHKKAIADSAEMEKKHISNEAYSSLNAIFARQIKESISDIGNKIELTINEECEKKYVSMCDIRQDRKMEINQISKTCNSLKRKMSTVERVTKAMKKETKEIKQSVNHKEEIVEHFSQTIMKTEKLVAMAMDSQTYDPLNFVIDEAEVEVSYQSQSAEKGLSETNKEINEGLGIIPEISSTFFFTRSLSLFNKLRITEHKKAFNDDLFLTQTNKEGRPFLLCCTCDGMIVDCIVDINLEDHYSNDVKYNYCTQVITDEFNELVGFQRKFQASCNDTLGFQTLIMKSIASSKPMVCRYILAHWNSFNAEVTTLKAALDYAIQVRNESCAKPIAWKIIKAFVALYPKMQFVDIWPGLQCRCKDKFEADHDQNKVKFCSTVFVIVCDVLTTERYAKNYFCEVPIKYLDRNNKGHSIEAESVSRKIDMLRKGNNAIGRVEGLKREKALEYFAKHSKLFVISPSPLKSRKFQQRQQFTQQPCIQMYCRAKGIIPIGEPHFPSSINAMPTDVLEGYAELLSAEIKIGSEIGIEGCSGTLGGFVKYLGEDAFLTCAHVVPGRGYLNSKTNRSSIHLKPIEVYATIKNGNLSEIIPCGKLRTFVFPPDKGLESSVDAAIIAINPAVKINPKAILVNSDGNDESIEYLGMTNPYLNFNYLDYKEIGISEVLPTITIGVTSGIQKSDNKIRIIDAHRTAHESLMQAVQKLFDKTPKPSGVTDDVHFRAQVHRQGEIESDIPRWCELYHQIAMSQINFQQGDSGMCIYVKTASGRCGCIGMAIASHPDGGCIITPIKPILAAFNML